MREEAKNQARDAGVGLSAGMMECASRQSGKGVLTDEVRRLRRRADQLEALARAIPDNFPLDADEGLWELAITSRR